MAGAVAAGVQGGKGAEAAPGEEGDKGANTKSVRASKAGVRATPSGKVRVRVRARLGSAEP